jgi:hypothetical protein
MSPAFLVQTVSPEDDTFITKVKVDRWLSLVVFSRKKLYVKKKYEYFMFVCTTVLYEYMNSHGNYVNNLFDNTHVQLKYIGSLSRYYLNRQ